MADKILRILTARLANPWLFLLLSLLLVLAAALTAASPRQPVILSAQPPDLGLLFTALLTLVALALTFSVEFFYLRDGFGVRMNTVFKFYFQAWLLLACACGFATGWVAQFAPSAVRVSFFVATATIFLACLVYPIMSIPARTRAFTTTPSLDGTINLRAANPDDWAAIDWLETQFHPGGKIPVLLEAPCQAYCYEGRISTFTGFPTLLGWASHEAQWRGNSVEQSRRQADIVAVYTSADPQKTLEILMARQVDYVILGKPERDYIATLCSQSKRPCSLQLTLENFARSLTPVFRSRDMIIFSVP